MSRQDAMTPKDLLGAAAFSLTHFLEQKMELRDAAERLWDEHARMAQAVGLPSQMMMILKDGKIESSTSSCREAFGVDLCGHFFLDKVTRQSGLDMEKRALERAEGKQVARDFTLDFVHAGGGTFRGELSVAEISADGMALVLLSLPGRTAAAMGAA